MLVFTTHNIVYTYISREGEISWRLAYNAAIMEQESARRLLTRATGLGERQGCWDVKPFEGC
jgi:hypothetical protein